MASGPTVLLIEDYDDNARIMIRSLEPHGFRIFRAMDGETGLRLAIEKRPDIILLDLGLPDVEGQT
ncbi:MAG: response regulator, partial [Chloroflexi bacterium]|nr:response regulator [Chloroflexota bacterium]